MSTPRHSSPAKAASQPVTTASSFISTWPSNTKLAKKLKKVGELVKCTSPEGRELIAWIRNAARQREKNIDSEAANLLAEWIGENLTALNSELDKLALFLGERDSIRPGT